MMDGKRLIEIMRETEVVRRGDASVRRYSGRGMYGVECVGLSIGRRASPVAIGAQMVMAIMDTYEGDDPGGEAEALLAILDATDSDSMGLGQIVYWPSVKWPDGVEDDDEREGA